jgi:dTDP-4-amino-4,6-dideoxygalactose transaminase
VWRHRFDHGAGPVIVADLPVTRSLTGAVLALPMSSELGRSQLARAVDALDRALEHG